MLQTIKKVGLRWLLRFCKLNMNQKDQRQALVDTFINAIYLYDDKVLITFNYKEGTQTVTFGEATEVASEGNGSDFSFSSGMRMPQLRSKENPVACRYRLSIEKCRFRSDRNGIFGVIYSSLCPRSSCRMARNCSGTSASVIAPGTSTVPAALAVS